MQYSDIIQEHFEHPRNVGTIEPADAEAWSRTRLRRCHASPLRIENNRITDAKFKTMGCPASRCRLCHDGTAHRARCGEALTLSRAEINTALGGAEPTEDAYVSTRRGRGARGAEKVSPAIKERYSRVKALDAPAVALRMTSVVPTNYRQRLTGKLAKACILP